MSKLMTTLIAAAFAAAGWTEANPASLRAGVRGIRAFAEGFKRAGATASNLTNWRVEREEQGHAIVAVDSTQQKLTLLLYVRPVFLGKKIDRIEWKQ